MKLLFAFWIFLNTFSFSNYKILNENQLDIINLNYQNSQYNENISYKSFIIPNKQYMYYGRLLKYYYSNNIFVSDNEINQISKNIIISGENSNIYNSLFIQNLVATTIMPSIYGSSSDAEFFAESFSKWLNTDNELRNKSWEVTNNFYLKILPEIIKIGGLVEGEYENNQTISHKAIELISKNSNLVKYNTKLSQKPSDSLELKYNNSSIIWTQEYSNNALKYIKNQVELEAKRSIIINDISIINITSKWMNDSYTKASKNSIDEFNVFNENHFFNFDNLDRKIANNSKDINSYSSVWFSHVFSNIEEAYLKSTPNLNSDGEKWTKEHTKQLKELTLKLYNVLFNLIKNETWVQNILSALIISPDFPLVSGDSYLKENVMGYTNTSYSYYVDSSNNFYSTAYSYIVIAGPSLTFQKFNSQYKNAFWSSPNKFSVWIHEMGHVLDAFGSKTINYRSINYSKKLDYKNLYKGQFFGDYIVSSSGPILIWIFATFSGVTIIIIVVFYLVKKCKKKL